MAVLTTAQLERGKSLAERERVTRWEWGDWAVDVAGHVGEGRANNGALRKLQAALDDLAAHGGYTMRDLPDADLLRQWRTAADAIPPKLRSVVRSIEVGRTLAGKVPDVRERQALIDRLAAEHADGIVSENAVRHHFGRVPVGPKSARQVTAERVAEALEDPEIRLDVLRSPEGIAAARSLERDLWTREHRPMVEVPLPSPPAFMRDFWRAVSAVDVAHDALERYGVGDVTMEPEAREAAERLARKAGEVGAAVVERAVEDRMMEG